MAKATSASVGPASTISDPLLDLGGKDSNSTLVPPNLQKENSMPMMNQQLSQMSPVKKPTAIIFEVTSPKKEIIVIEKVITPPIPS